MKNNIIILMALVCLSINSRAQEEEFKPNGKIFGEVFGDYYYKLSGDTGSTLTGKGEYQKIEKDFNAFSLRRFNLGYEYQFSKKFSGRLLLEGTDEENLANDKRGVNIKNGCLTWKDIFPGSSLIIGGQATFTYAITDKTWGYRSMEKDITDFRGFGKSNDWGLTLKGDILDDELLSYAVMVGNGTAQKAETNMYKKLYAAITSKLLEKNLLIDLYFDYEPLSDTTGKMMLKAFLSYQINIITLGIEPFVFIDQSEEIKPFGIEIFTKAKILDNFNAFARIDLYNPDIDTDTSGYNEIFSMIGLEYSPVKNVSFMPNIWINLYNPKLEGDYKRKSDIVPRLTFRYKF